MPDPTTLSELASATEAQLRAVVDMEGCSFADFSEAAQHGLIAPHNGDGEPVRTAKGERWLAELRRMADGLSDEDAGALAKFCDVEHWSAWDVLETLALVTCGGCSFGCARITPLGRAVLSLRLREQEGER